MPRTERDCVQNRHVGGSVRCVRRCPTHVMNGIDDESNGTGAVLEEDDRPRRNGTLSGAQRLKVQHCDDCAPHVDDAGLNDRGAGYGTEAEGADDFPHLLHRNPEQRPRRGDDQPLGAMVVVGQVNRLRLEGRGRGVRR
jgi:hypothetical protein